MERYVTGILNRFSMYKVVSLSLTGLFVAALILSFVGILPYSPLAMLASVLVLGFSVFLASLLFGKLFGVRVHTESSFITPMILFFIFTPTLEVSGLVVLALIGLTAAASKFILVYKGRHLFNPVAIATLITSVTGLGYATWWVATPSLILITLALGYLVIQKTRRVHMSGTFMGLSVLIVIGLLLGEGNSLPESLILLFSWPIFFFSAFMLTEPLTMPPKKWQQVVEAVVVAILFAIPIHFGDFVTGPAFALVAGNLLAFIFRRQQHVSLKFKQMKQLTPTSFEFIFTPLKKISYEAGQYVEMTLPHKKDDLRGVRRSFSMTSAPGEKTLRLGVKFYEPSSSFKKALKSLEAGSTVQLTGINGDFTLPKDSSTPLLFIAGGIGITPFMSHLQHLKRIHEQRDIILLYAVSDISEIAYKDILIETGVKVVVVTKESKGFVLPAGWSLAKEPYVTKEVIEKYVPHVIERMVYISGPPLMIDGAKRFLKQLKVKHIKTDYFIGY